MIRRVWIDIETTGLNPDVHQTIEIAVIITEGLLGEEIARYRGLVRHNANTVWSEWAMSKHMESGLMDSAEIEGKTAQQVDEEICHFLEFNGLGNQRITICGQSVHFDQSFIKIDFPMLSKKLSHRTVDVRSFMELAQEIDPTVIWEEAPHLAGRDIEVSRRNLNKALEIINHTGPRQEDKDAKIQQLAQPALRDMVSRGKIVEALKNYDHWLSTGRTR